MGVVNIAREKATGVNGAPVSPHLLAVFTACIEVGYLVSAKDIMHILSELCLKRGHNCEFLANEDLGEEFYGSRENHGLFLEVFDMSTFGKELWHIVYTMTRLFREKLASAREDGGANEDRYVRKC